MGVMITMEQLRRKAGITEEDRMTDYERNIFEKALDFYGTEHQTTKLLEEMGELGVELCRMQDGRSSLDRVASEMADVSILLDQLQMRWQCGGLVQRWRLEKTRRLEERLRKDRDEEILASASARTLLPRRRKEPKP